MTADLTVIILTYNEEENIAHALQSVCGWARQVIVLDSFSADRTLAIAHGFDAACATHRFEGFVQQRNYALDSLPLEAEWVLFLDADEWITDELKAEISARLSSTPAENGFYLKRRFFWMGRWIRRGYYPTWILRLMRRGTGRWEARSVNEHLIVEGAVGHLGHDIVHQDRKSLGDWTDKHNRYAALEANELLAGSDGRLQVSPRLLGSQAERKRWLRRNIWDHLPLLVRPAIYFIYRYVLRAGFLDGRAGFSYHFLHALWYPMLIDLKYLETVRSRSVCRSRPETTQQFLNGRYSAGK